MSTTYIISEIGINHNGDIELAKELIKLSADSCADAVKFQKRTLDMVYTKEELDKYRESPWGTTNRQQKQGLEFDIRTYKQLQDYTKSLGLDFIVSCWGMCTEEQICAAIDVLDNVEYVLACTSTYPTQPEEINLKHICTLKDKHPDIKVGFSNHYSGHDACVGAAALGAECIEFHATKSRTMYGSDQAASIEKIEALVDAIRTMELMLGNGTKQVYGSEIPIMNKLRKVSDVTD